MKFVNGLLLIGVSILSGCDVSTAEYPNTPEGICRQCLDAICAKQIDNMVRSFPTDDEIKEIAENNEQLKRLIKCKWDTVESICKMYDADNTPLHCGYEDITSEEEKKVMGGFSIVRMHFTFIERQGGKFKRDIGGMFVLWINGRWVVMPKGW